MFIRNVGFLRTAWRYNPQNRILLHSQGIPRRMETKSHNSRPIRELRGRSYDVCFFRILNSAS
jgi:hypothetical protein